MEFWDLFDYLCAKKGVSRRKTCEEMGFSTSLASKAKYAGTKPKSEFVYACSQYFGVTVDYLSGCGNISVFQNQNALTAHSDAF